MSAQAVIDDRLIKMNQKIGKWWGGGFHLDLSAEGSESLAIKYKTQNLMSIYVVGMKPSEILQTVFEITKACGLFANAYNTERDLFEPFVREWREKMKAKELGTEPQGSN